MRVLSVPFHTEVGPVTFLVRVDVCEETWEDSSLLSSFECTEGFKVETGERKLEFNPVLKGEAASGEPTTSDVFKLEAVGTSFTIVFTVPSLEIGTEVAHFSDTSEAEGTGVC